MWLTLADTQLADWSRNVPHTNDLRSNGNGGSAEQSNTGIAQRRYMAASGFRLGRCCFRKVEQIHGSIYFSAY